MLLSCPRCCSQVYHIGGHYTSFGEMAEIGRKIIPDMKITFNEDFPVMTHVQIDYSLMTKEIGVQHRSLYDGYFDLINLTRKENNLPPIEKK